MHPKAFQANIVFCFYFFLGNNGLMKEVISDHRSLAFEIGESILEPFRSQERDLAYFICILFFFFCHPAYARLPSNLNSFSSVSLKTSLNFFPFISQNKWILSLSAFGVDKLHIILHCFYICQTPNFSEVRLLYCFVFFFVSLYFQSQNIASPRYSC